MADFKMREFLQKNLDTTNEWLKFAEAKNAMLIGANIAIIGVLNTAENLNSCFVLLASLTCVASSVVVLFSFFAKVGKEPYKLNPNEGAANNSGKENSILIFWGDQAKYEAADFLKKCYKKYCQKDITDGQLDAFEMDYAREIVYNARITQSKYNLFNAALRIDVIGILLWIAVFMIYRFLCPACI